MMMNKDIYDGLKKNDIIIGKPIAENIYTVVSVKGKLVDHMCCKVFTNVPLHKVSAEYEIAVKCYHADPAHFMRIYGKPVMFFTEDTSPFGGKNTCFAFMMEMGSSLIVSSSKRMSWYIEFMQDIAQAIAVMHSENIVHFDIKASNTVIKTDHRYAIIDFGISKYLDAGDDINLFDINGTPYYLPPEVLTGTLSHKCDIYSFGMLIRDILLHGKERTIMGQSKNKWLLTKKKLQPLHSDDKYVQRFLSIVNKMTEFSPINRYQDIWEILEEINNFPVLPDIKLCGEAV